MLMFNKDISKTAKNGRFLKMKSGLEFVIFQVFIPADGMAEFQRNLAELIHEYDNGNYFIYQILYIYYIFSNIYSGKWLVN